MANFVSTVMDFVEQVHAAPDAESFHAATFEALQGIFPSDHVFWTRTDFVHGTAKVRALPEGFGPLEAALGRFGPAHPAIRTYVADPSDLSPRRMSDVSSAADWHASALYSEFFRHFGAAHQLSMVVSVDPRSGVGVGWTLTRSGRDFADTDVDLAGRLLPVLYALELRYQPATASASGLSSVTLSPREHEVLALLADGLTGAAIGRRLGITERTVRKHLHAVYRALGCADRLVAVERARQTGLLGP